MKLFPPFSRKIVDIPNKQKFITSLKRVTETHHTLKGSRYKGKINKFHFLIKRKSNIFNTNRPRIKGRFKNGNQLIIEIVSRKFIPIIIFGMGVLTELLGIYKDWKLATLLSFIVILFLYCGMWILHLIELKKTKAEIDFIINELT